MKTKTIKLTLALGAMALASGTWADTNTATATATANVVAPLTVAKESDMNFGTFAATPDASVMKLSTIGGITGTAKTFGGTPSVAKFWVTGDAARAFSISYLGSSDSLVCAAPCVGSPMKIEWTAVAMSAKTAATDLSDGSKVRANATGVALTAGEAHIFAGGNLEVGPYQPAGTYTGNLVVTVAYN